MKDPSFSSFDQFDLLNEIFPVSRETLRRLEIYKLLLLQWQEKTNLVAPSTLKYFWTRHVADSLQLMALAPDARHWTDIGSGGGFPGMVIAILLHQTRQENGYETSVRLVESIQKKCAFLRRVAIETGTAADICAMRIESATKQIAAAEVISARALASLDKLLSLTGPHLVGSKKALFHKGRDYLSELSECDGKWKFDLVVHASKIDADSVILEISNVKQPGQKNPK